MDEWSVIKEFGVVRPAPASTGQASREDERKRPDERVALDLLTTPVGRYILELARSQSIRQAADRLQIAPSAISRQLYKLEQAVGSQLIERRSDGVQLTEAGHLIVRHLAEIQERMDRVASEVADLKALRRGTVQIATVEGITTPFLAEKIAAYRERHPAVAFRMKICGRQRVMEALEQRVSHIGFLYDHFSHPAIEEAGKWRQPLMALAPAGHRFADRRAVTLSDLAQEPCVLPDETFGIHHLVKRSFASAGLSPRFEVQADQLHFLREYALCTGAIIYLPLQAARPDVAARRLVPLNLDCAEFRHRHIFAVVRRDQTLPPAAAVFLQEIVHAFAEGERADAALLAEVTGAYA